ncbi:hypothetical protein, partial [Tenacibaculum maritimum]|uniref:hypothetical protein n=1 Tax=Tenacibaculum maritimum TaxID=107401 RepID=UPI001F19FB21
GYFEIDFNKDLKHLTFSKKGYRKFNLSTFSRQNKFTRELPFGDTIYIISKESNKCRHSIQYLRLVQQVQCITAITADSTTSESTQ